MRKNYRTSLNILAQLCNNGNNRYSAEISVECLLFGNINKTIYTITVFELDNPVLY